MKQEIPLAAASSLARRIVAELAPGCARIEIAGSIRRECDMIGDIEIVAIPNFDLIPAAQPDLFGEAGGGLVSLLDVQIERLLHEKPDFTRGNANGEKYKKFQINETVQLDLFITTRPQWGVIYAIRTGSAAFSKRIVTQRAAGGLLPSEYQIRDGWLWHNGVKVATPDEATLFDVCGGWVEPKDRH